MNPEGDKRETPSPDRRRECDGEVTIIRRDGGGGSFCFIRNGFADRVQFPTSPRFQGALPQQGS